jgi:hypothetical protein
MEPHRIVTGPGFAVVGSIRIRSKWTVSAKDTALESQKIPFLKFLHILLRNALAE